MRLPVLTTLLLFHALAAEGQERFSISVPVTVTAGGLYTHRLKTGNPSASPFAPAIRGFVSPEIRFGRNWFAAASVHASSTPFFPFQAYDARKELFVRVIQAYVGYRYSSGTTEVTVKVGKVATAFGSFPLRYEDDQNPLIGAPVGYGSAEYGPLNYPITLYGLPGIEVSANLGKADARFQFTNSSPANPARLFGGGQSSNWSAGAGYTLRQGLRAGVSFYRGGYLKAGRFLLPAEKSGEWPATAIGFDTQWNSGHWSFTAEWSRFQFPYPRFRINPTITTAYVEAKRNLLPRLFVAARVGMMPHGVFQGNYMAAPVSYPPGRKVIESSVGIRLSRSQLLKVGYEWSRKDNVRGTLDNVFGVQLVIALPNFSKAF